MFILKDGGFSWILVGVRGFERICCIANLIKKLSPNSQPQIRIQQRRFETLLKIADF